jgi:C4-dicarboxylate-specific signal transduction histidine kinase
VLRIAEISQLFDALATDARRNLAGAPPFKLDQFLCFAVYSANEAFNRVYKPLLETLQLTYPQYVVMVLLWERDNRSDGELGERLFLKARRLAVSLRRLETLGYIKQSPDAANERHVRIRLTESGKTLRAKAEHIPGCILGASGLNARRAKQLATGITTLRDSLERELPHANRVTTIEQLTASITHEVNQPIAAARNNVHAALNFLDRNPPDLKEIREALVSAASNTDRAGAVVGRMRAFMQKAPTGSDPIDMNEVVSEMIELVRGEAVKNRVSVKIKLTKGPPTATGDRVQLQQVVLNLLLNSLQALGAMTEGSRQLQITTSQTESNYLCVGIQDTGPGLNPEILSRLFEPFYTTKTDGMGMGLTICRSIVETHGGRLWATACEPHGALFQFTIPTRPLDGTKPSDGRSMVLSSHQTPKRLAR